MDVILYLRYSSDRQNEQSIEGQMRICKQFCERMGYTIVDMYIDRALSAAKDTEKRVEFQRMIRDSDKRLWQGVVVYKLDRFARNRYDSAIYKARLKKNGVRLISATENIGDNPESIILESVLEGMAEFYSKELSQKITRGMYESALKCNSCGGHISLGYKIENKKLVIDPKTAPIVREAFDLYAAGWSVADICKKFNAAGYRSKRGAEFNKNSFQSMFRNEKYIGVYRYMDVRVEGGVPAIVDVDTFNQVQKRLNKNAQAPARGKALVDYMLSGKLFCGHCGSPMTGAASTSHTGRKYFYYCCTNNRAHKGCTKSNVRKDMLEQAIVDDTLELLSSEMIEYLADLAVEASRRDISENTLIPSLQAEIAEYDKSIDRLLKLVENGAESVSLSKRLNELEQQKHSTEKKLLYEQSQVVLLEKPQVIYFLTEFTKGDRADPVFQRRIIDLLVNSVILWDDTDDPDGGHILTITYNLQPKKTRTIRLKDLPSARCVFVPDKSTITSKYAPYLINRVVFAINVKHRFV